jgi:signal transduction histidine kinase
MTGLSKPLIAGWSIQDFRRHITQLTPHPGSAQQLPFDSDSAFSLDFIRPSPRSIYCQVRTFDGNGTPGALVAYFRDTSRETELDRLKSEFLATAAHELRTPLTMVAGYAELLNTCEFEPEIQKEMTGSIMSQSQRLIAIVSDLLDLSRLESRAGRDFNIVPQALEPIIHEAIEAARQGRDIQFVGGDSPRPAEVPVDAEKFKLALIKVLDNARIYSPPDMPIEVDVRFRTAQGSRELGVEIIDYGIGMSENSLVTPLSASIAPIPRDRFPAPGWACASSRKSWMYIAGGVEITSQLAQARGCACG